MKKYNKKPKPASSAFWIVFVVALAVLAGIFLFRAEGLMVEAGSIAPLPPVEPTGLAPKPTTEGYDECVKNNCSSGFGNVEFDYKGCVRACVDKYLRPTLTPTPTPEPTEPSGSLSQPESLTPQSGRILSAPRRFNPGEIPKKINYRYCVSKAEYNTLPQRQRLNYRLITTPINNRIGGEYCHITWLMGQQQQKEVVSLSFRDGDYLDYKRVLSRRVSLSMRSMVMLLNYGGYRKVLLDTNQNRLCDAVVAVPTGNNVELRGIRGNPDCRFTNTLSPQSELGDNQRSNQGSNQGSNQRSNQRRDEKVEIDRDNNYFCFRREGGGWNCRPV